MLSCPSGVIYNAFSDRRQLKRERINIKKIEENHHSHSFALETRDCQENAHHGLVHHYNKNKRMVTKGVTDLLGTETMLARKGITCSCTVAGETR